MTTVVGDLDVGDQQIEQLALLGLPDHLLVQQLAAARPQQLDYARTMSEVVPEPLGVEQFQFLFLVAGQFAQAPIVEQEPPILVDDAHRSRTIVENFAKLALLLGDLRLVLRQRGDVVNPQHALAADKTDMPAVVGDLHVGQQEMNQRAFLGPPYHLFIQNLAALIAQLVDDPRALIEVMPMRAGVAKVEFILAVSQNFAQPRVVEQQPAILIDHQQRRGAELQHLAELTLVLGRLGSRSRAAIGRRRSACSWCQKTCGFRRTDLANASIEARRIRGSYGRGKQVDVRADVTFGLISGRDTSKSRSDVRLEISN